MLLAFQYIPAGHHILELTPAMLKDPKSAVGFKKLKKPQRNFNVFARFHHIHEARHNLDLHLAMFTQPIFSVR